ncbi:CynX/NimT family MFS transporter [Paenibacillus chungangensis]|uniref:CynX/NimT family MFS transporter n=1 Tax=Paenibacillus chungangensis TaxID=696535 RepID=A0ABW3HMA8_9BACL
MSSRDQSDISNTPVDYQSRDIDLKGVWLLVGGIILLSIVLRAPITIVGPIVEQIQNDLGLSGAAMGLLTTLPLLAFGLFSPFAPTAAAKYGLERTLLFATILLTLAIIVRSLAGSAALFIGTVLIGAGIAFANVLLPSLVKRDFPERIGLMTGIYTVAMNLGAAVGSGFSYPLTVGFGISWAGTLASCAVIALAATIVWVQLTKSSRRRTVDTISIAGSRSNGRGRVWGSTLAWMVSLFLALQSFCFYVNVTWIPTILADKGLSHTSAGWMLSLMQVISMGSTFIVPIVAGKQKSQRGLALLMAAMFVAGYVGLLVGSAGFVIPVMILLGLGVGGGFGLAVMFFALRASTSEISAKLSGMAQSVGYLLAATGPFLFGYLHDRTGSWTWPLIVIIIVSIAYGIVGLWAGADKKI